MCVKKLLICFTVLLLLLAGSACNRRHEEVIIDDDNNQQEIQPDSGKKEDEKKPDDPKPSGKGDPFSGIVLNVTDEGQIISYASEDYYCYGPSIMKYEDGSYDAWFSSPGNSGSQWDWITYRHSDDGENWRKRSVFGL